MRIVKVASIFFLFITLVVSGCGRDKQVKANSLQVVYQTGTKILGEVEMKLGTLSPEASGPVKVIIFREITPQHQEIAKKWGVKVGGAYIQKGPTEYKYICDVDLILSDEELAKQFQVETM